MIDKETGLTLRTLQATDKYIDEVYGLKNADYTFPQALRDAGYTNRYIHSYGSRIWQNIGVQSKIEACKAKNKEKVEVTVQQVLINIEYGVQKCKERGNMAAMARFIEMQGRYLAMFTDNINQTDTQRQRELDEKEEKECQEIARERLKAFKQTS